MARRSVPFPNPHVVAGVEEEFWLVPAAGTTKISTAPIFEWIKKKYATASGPRGGSNDLFFYSGHRIYEDQSGAIEAATADCITAQDLTNSILAARQIITQAAIEAGLTLSLQHVDIFGNTNGCHANFGIRQGDLAGPFHATGHLFASMVAVSGEGGLDPMAPGLLFSLAPRAFHSARAGIGAWGRPEDVRREPHSQNNTQRLHMTGATGSPQSQIAMLVRAIASTAVAGHADHDRNFLADIDLGSARAALLTYARDPELTSCYKGRAALDHQRELLEACNRALHSKGPVIADEERHLDLWERVLTLAEERRWRSSSLDYAILYDCFAELAEQNRIPWPIPREINDAVNLLWHSHTGGRPAMPGLTLTTELADRLLADSNVAKRVNRLLKERPITLLRKVIEVRPQFWELNVRFAAPGGIFDTLAEKGLLTHSAPSVDATAITKMTEEPPLGRARQRARFIKRTSALTLADWGSITVIDDGIGGSIEHFVFPDPAGAEPVRRRDRAVESRLAPMLLNEQAKIAFRLGNYKTACRTFENITAGRDNRFYSWALARCGQLAEAREALNQHYSHRSNIDSLAEITDSMNITGFSALFPEPDSLMQFYRRGRCLIRRSPVNIFSPLVFEYFAHSQVRRDPRSALRAANRALSLERATTNEDRVVGRILCVRARANMMLHSLGLADSDLGEAERLQRAANQLGDLVTFALPLKAFLAPTRTLAEEALTEAIEFAGHENPIGRARAELSLAVIRKNATARCANRIRALFDRISTTTTCPTAQHILANWRQWIQTYGGFPLNAGSLV